MGVFIAKPEMPVPPNKIKYSTIGDGKSIRADNFAVGINSGVRYGPTSSTDYWNGITPPASGYTVYINKASQGPSIYTPQDDAGLVWLANYLAGSSVANNVTDALYWFHNQTDMFVANIDYPDIVASGLTLCLDGGFVSSYPRSGTTWTDLSFNVYSSTLVNGPTYGSANGGSIVFDGANDYAITPNLLNPSSNPNESVFVWFYPTSAGQIVSELGQQTINAGWHDSNIEISSGGAFSFSIWHGSLTNRVVSTARPFNAWYNLGFTYSGTTLTAYINGSSIGTTTFTRQTNTSLYYGLCSIDSTNMGTAGYAGGRMGGFMFYNRALSQAEITQNHNAQKTRFGL